MPEPTADRPYVPDYGLPESADGLLAYEHITERLQAARNYWVCTVRPDGRPHSMPVWGVLVDGKVHFGGGPRTRKARNLEGDPHVVVHTESGDEVAIIEGTATVVDDDDVQTRVDDAYEAKYGFRHGPFVWVVEPRVAFGWTKFPDTVTRWSF